MANPLDEDFNRMLGDVRPDRQEKMTADDAKAIVPFLIFSMQLSSVGESANSLMRRVMTRAGKGLLPEDLPDIERIRKSTDGALRSIDESIAELRRMR